MEYLYILYYVGYLGYETALYVLMNWNAELYALFAEHYTITWQ